MGMIVPYENRGGNRRSLATFDRKAIAHLRASHANRQNFRGAVQFAERFARFWCSQGHTHVSVGASMRHFIDQSDDNQVSTCCTEMNKVDSIVYMSSARCYAPSTYRMQAVKWVGDNELAGR